MRTEVSTRGHVLVVMLAYLLERQLDACWRWLDLTLAEGLDELGSLRAVELTIGEMTCQKLPEPTGLAAQLLRAADIELPPAFPVRHVNGATRKKPAPGRTVP